MTSLSRREIVLITLLLVMVAAGAYFLFFLQPTLDDLTRLRAEREQYRDESSSALMRIVQFGQLQREYYGVRNSETGEYENSLHDAWHEATEYVMDEFRDTEILRLIQNIVHPHAVQGTSVAVDFRPATYLGYLYSYPVALTFTVSGHAALNTVIAAFNDYESVTRIVSYSVSSAAGNIGILFDNLNVSLTVEFVSFN